MTGCVDSCCNLPLQNYLLEDATVIKQCGLEGRRLTTMSSCHRHAKAFQQAGFTASNKDSIFGGSPPLHCLPVSTAWLDNCRWPNIIACHNFLVADGASLRLSTSPSAYFLKLLQCTSSLGSGSLTGVCKLSNNFRTLLYARLVLQSLELQALICRQHKPESR